MTTTLYRAYDERDRLLYIGIADDPLERLSQHSGVRSSWSRYVTWLTFERFATRKEAAAAELAAIRSQDPVFNIQGRPYERWLRWAAAYPNGDPDEIDLDAVVRDAQRLVDGLFARSP